MKQSILIIDDEVQIRKIFKKYLEKCGYEAHEANCIADARKAMTLQSFDSVLIDQNLPDGYGIDIIPECRSLNPEMAIVVITGSSDVPLIVEAMRRGADNFLTKPVNMADLELFLRKSLEIGALRRSSKARTLLAKPAQYYFGGSAAINSVMELARIAAENEHPVLITGETGVGKGVLARWIHERTAKRSGSFVEINCSGLRGELLASQLFGHAKGAFTSAIKDSDGLLDVADGGTLFLDEIGDMESPIQAQLLKVIEEKTYRRLGEVRTRKSDFRLICATNKDLAEDCNAGRFRKDLYYRLQVLPISIPALRERPEDIKGFTTHILTGLCHENKEVAPDVLALLESYQWQGNIRELRNVLERATLLARGGPIQTRHLPGLERAPESIAARPAGDLSKLEEETIKAAVLRAGGDMNKASKTLGISVSTIYRKIKQYRISSDV